MIDWNSLAILLAALVRLAAAIIERQAKKNPKVNGKRLLLTRGQTEHDVPARPS